MGPPEIVNDTPFLLEPLFLADVQSRPVFVALVKATYTIGVEGRLCLSEQPVPPNLAGQYHGDPETSSLRFEPEGVYFKPSTDVVLLGHAHAPEQKPVTELAVGFRVGALQKVVRVIGNRVARRRAGLYFFSEPEPFLTMPLRYERAFGGWDRSHRNPDRHRVEARNPVGVGCGPDAPDSDAIVLPNLEDPSAPLTRMGEAPAPAGFGFIAPHWQPRAAFAGTYDKAWNATRKPRLPLDFDARFFNAASPGLVAPTYLNGDEPVVVVNAAPASRLVFHLPGVAAPICELAVRGRKAECLPMRLDTVIVNADAFEVYLSWRAHTVLPQGPHQMLRAWVH